MLRWHMTFERKLVEQSVLPALTFPHHRQHSNPPDRIESPPPCPDNSRFFQHNRRIFAIHACTGGRPKLPLKRPCRWVPKSAELVENGRSRGASNLDLPTKLDD